MIAKKSVKSLLLFLTIYLFLSLACASPLGLISNNPGRTSAPGSSKPEVSSNPLHNGSSSRVVYVKRELGDEDIYNIVLYDLSKNKETYLTDNESAGVDYLFPQVSPDGKTIIFQLSTKMSSDAESWWKNEIYRMSIDGANMEKITEIETPDDGSEDWSDYIREMTPSWSVDGSGILLTSNRADIMEGTFDPDAAPVNLLYSLNLKTRQYTLLDSAQGNMLRPMQSPDGKLIVMNTVVNGYTKILMINADNSGKASSFGWKDTHLYSPVWSPDGKKLTFTSNREESLDLYTIEIVPGSNQVRANSVVSLTAANSSADEYRPCWSPDGSWLLFASDRENETKHIYLYQRTTGEVKRMSKYEGEEDMPVWVP